jgi:predicted metal-binding membrane protein
MAERTNVGAPRALPVLGVTVGLAALGWVVAVRQMRGMDMGVATGLGSFGFFAGAWTAMTVAMMLPSAAPAVMRTARTRGCVRALLDLLPGYLGVWIALGALAYALYEPHSPEVAGAVTLAAGLYELTPLKRRARRDCLVTGRSGMRLGIACVGSDVGLMAVMLAVGAMSAPWMAVIAAAMFVQKVVAPTTAIDLAFALAVVALGTVIVLAPAAVPGLTPSM